MGYFVTMTFSKLFSASSSDRLRAANPYLIAAAVGLLAAVAGCGSNVVTVEDDSATSSSSGDGGNGAGGASSSSSGVGGGVQLDCASACGQPSEQGCFDEAACLDLCASQNGSWTDSSAAAFSQCASEEALCFETLEGCTWRVLYPDPIDVSATLQGEGLFPYEGKVVYARLESQQASPLNAAVIQDGFFEMTLTANAYIGWGPSAIIWIDLNNDEVCGPEDATAISTTIVSPPFDAPVLSVTAELSFFQNGGFACDLL